jgi:secondary thiamine-phosphate synthase enzyme
MQAVSEAHCYTASVHPANQPANIGSAMAGFDFRDPIKLQPILEEIMVGGRLEILTKKKIELIDITHLIDNLLPLSVHDGVLFLFNPHTTAGLTINEGADPDVSRDIISGLSAMLPENLPFRHEEGNSPSHIMASLVGSSLTVFVENRHLMLGRWQKIFFCEFDGPRTRNVIWRFAPTL